ncbi:tetratricopeptide repeat protein [Humidesulfovibrio idahonensis]
MHTAEKTKTPTGRRPHLLIHNLYNYGHFLVYADNLTVWALSRGFCVTLMGRGLAGTFYQRRHQDDPNVQLLDASPGERLDQNLPLPTKAELTARACDELCQAQARLKPEACVLLSADEFLFQSASILDPDFAFPAPTVGVVTFGHRDCHLGFKDVYARNLDDVLARRRPFRSVLTLDEHQVAAVDPGEEHLVFLPDIYADPSRPKTVEQARREAAETAELAAFLDRARGPVLPVLGKVDQRKNALWVLRAASQTPGACCVLLGQRVPSPDDAAVDGLLAELAAQGRAFVRTDYVPESLFRAVLTHPAVPFLPLPYSCHYGSSGLQLQALAAGKPTLVPDVGLMAWRVQAHALGLCYRHGDEADFRRVFDRLLQQGTGPYAEAIGRFMGGFAPEARNAQLDKAFGLAGASAAPRSCLVACAASSERLDAAAQALVLLHAGRAEEALKLLEHAEAGAPEDAGLLRCRALALHALGRQAEAWEVAQRCGPAIGETLTAFQLNLCCDAMTAARTRAERQESLSMLCLLLHFVPVADIPEPLPAPQHPLELALRKRWRAPCIGPASWRSLADELVRLKRNETAVPAYRRVLELDPQALDCWLNLSDVLRYEGRYDESDAALDELAARSPEHSGLRHKRGQVLFERGKLVQAREEFLREPLDSPHRQAAEAYLRKCPVPIGG